MFSSWPWTRDIRPRGLQRRPWTMERFLFSPIQDIKAIKKDTAPGIINMTPQKMRFAVPTARSFAIPQQTGTEKESTAAPPKTVSTDHPKPAVRQTRKGRRYSQPTSGRNTWTLWRAFERPTWVSRFMPSEKRPLSGFLRMQKRNTPCVIHTTEV